MKISKGFTLVEVLLVIGVFAILTSFVTFNLLRPQTKTAVDTTTTALVAEMKQQQIKAMVGDTEGTGTTSPYGIFFEANRYTLFRGSSYSSSDPYNFVVDIEAPMTLSSTFSGGNLVFQRLGGEVSGWASGANSVTIQNSETGDSKTITVNRYGVVSLD